MTHRKRRSLTGPWVGILMLVSLAMLAHDARAGGNDQRVVVRGAAVNAAAFGASARMSQASTRGAISGANRQAARVGTVVNAAAGGASAEVNIAAVKGGVRGANSQSAIVSGAVLNGAALGTSSVVNIGSD